MLIATTLATSIKCNLCSLSMAGEIVPLSCALRFKPPTLVLLYKDLQTGTQ